MARDWKWQHSENIIARKINKSELQGFRRTDVILGPNEAGVLIQDGKIDDTITQTRVREFTPNILNKIMDIIFGSHDSDLLLVNTSLLDIEDYLIDIVNAENKEQSGKYTFRFKINLNEISKVFNLIGGAKKLTKLDLKNKLKTEVMGDIFSPIISKYSEMELRNNKKIIEEIENEVYTSMRKTFNMWGLSLISLHIMWSTSKKEDRYKNKYPESKEKIQLSKNIEVGRDYYGEGSRRVENIEGDKYEYNQ